MRARRHGVSFSRFFFANTIHVLFQSVADAGRSASIFPWISWVLAAVTRALEKK